MDQIIVKQIEELLNSEHILSALSNISALIYHELPFIDWAGFYFYHENELILGPFQGKIACSNIKIGKGVCGVSFEKRMLLNVPDVHKFEGHIACDQESNSELVVPLIYEDKIFGVLDLDSNQYYRFGSVDEELFTLIADLISKKLNTLKNGSQV